MMRLHNRFGDLLVAGGRAEAEKQYRSGVTIGEEMLPSQTKDLALRRDLADCYTRMGRFYEKQNPAESREWYQKDLDIWIAWPRFATSGHFDQARRELAVRDIARVTSASDSHQ